MSVPSLPRRSVHIFIAVVAALSAIAGASSSALAARHHGLSIVRPYRTNVSGKIFFAVRGVKPRALRIVFSIDGRRVWSAGRLSPRLSRPTAIDTRKLRNGSHVLTVRVTYANLRTALARKTIVVRNRKPVTAHATSAGKKRTGSGGAVGSGGSVGSGGTGSGSGAGTGSASGGGTGVVSPPPSGVSGPSVAAFNRESYLYSSNLSASQEANRYQVIVLDAHDYPQVAALKAANPNLKVLLYEALWLTNSDDYSYLQTATGCTAYADDAANHPTWFLHDSNGNKVLGVNRTDLYALDLGNPAYQQACVNNSAAFAKRYGYDGVFFDVVDGNLALDVTAGITIPEYPTAASWQNAINSALAYAGPALRAQGLLAFGNVSGAASTSQWEQWVGHLDGVEEESWTDAGSGPAQQIPWWSQKLTELSWALANGKYEIVHSYNGGESANVYGLAAMMLAANGRASYATSNTDYTYQENWFSEYDTAQQLGAPAGPYTVLANGVYERAFANGIVLVNPTASSISSFSLGGGTYTGTGLTNVSSVAMGPTSGLILLKTG